MLLLRWCKIELKPANSIFVNLIKFNSMNYGAINIDPETMGGTPFLPVQEFRLNPCLII